jgi:hypothetical protein
MSRPSTELAHLFRQLKAPAAARALPKLADRARQEEWSFEQFAAALLKTETDSRDSHGGQSRIKVARFPARKTIEEFDFAFQASLPKNTILHLGQLHGGLHLYDAGSYLKKLTWSRSGIAMVDQIRAALANATYPLVVTEGSTAEKLARIEHSPYLHRGLKSMTQCGGSLFIYGHSLDDSDAHVMRRIEEGGCATAYVSLYGSSAGQSNLRIRHRAELMVERRSAHENGKPVHLRKPLRVEFFDAETAHVWA